MTLLKRSFAISIFAISTIGLASTLEAQMNRNPMRPEYGGDPNRPLFGKDPNRPAYGVPRVSSNSGKTTLGGLKMRLPQTGETILFSPLTESTGTWSSIDDSGSTQKSGTYEIMQKD
jgi:hypothetical protein